MASCACRARLHIDTFHTACTQHAHDQPCVMLRSCTAMDTTAWPQCTSTYSRKRTTVRSELALSKLCCTAVPDALTWCSSDGSTCKSTNMYGIASEDRKSCERRGPSCTQRRLSQNSPKPTERKRLKRSFTQLHLDAGQVDFTCTACKGCGFVYAKGKEEDEKLHAGYHDQSVNGFTFQGWQQERVVKLDNSQKSRVILVVPEDPEHHLRRVRSICSMLEDKLGLCTGWLLSGAWQVYLYVLSNKRLVGCVVSEKITIASPLAFPNTDLKPATQSLTASPQPSTHMQLLTPMSAPPLDQHRRFAQVQSASNAESSSFASAVRAAGVSCPTLFNQTQNEKQLGTSCSRHSLPLQELNHNHMTMQPQTASRTAMGRSLQHASMKDTLLTRWLVASRCKAPAKSCADKLKAAVPTSDSSAVERTLETHRQHPRASDDTLQCSTGAHLPCPDVCAECCNTPAEAAVTTGTDKAAVHGAQPDTPKVTAEAAQTDMQDMAAQASSRRHHKVADNDMSCLHSAAASNPANDVTAQHAASQHVVLLDTTKSVKVDCGIRVMWVSSDHQRQGIATHMLDAVSPSWVLQTQYVCGIFASKVVCRCNATAGFVIPRNKLAFSQPTMAGQCFAQCYTQTCQFLVYQ